jgi:hypothetical protein
VVVDSVLAVGAVVLAVEGVSLGRGAVAVVVVATVVVTNSVEADVSSRLSADCSADAMPATIPTQVNAVSAPRMRRSQRAGWGARGRRAISLCRPITASG